MIRTFRRCQENIDGSDSPLQRREIYPLQGLPEDHRARKICAVSLSRNWAHIDCGNHLDASHRGSRTASAHTTENVETP